MGAWECSEFFHLLEELDETKIVISDKSGLKHVSAMSKNRDGMFFWNNFYLN